MHAPGLSAGAAFAGGKRPRLHSRGDQRHPGAGAVGAGDQHTADIDPALRALVENLPADVLAGRDAQLEAAIAYLMERIEQDPRVTPDPPPYPNKSKPE